MTEPTPGKRARGETSYHAGIVAEEIAARHYAQAGAVLLDERWRGKGGEIDLVVQDGEVIVFVEVKQARDFETAAARITEEKQQRLFSAAAEYLGHLPKGELTETRFDAALIDGQGALQILHNVFGP